MILIVDDERNNRIIISKFLDHLRFEHEAVPSGKEAVDLTRKKHVELVLMDIQMPGMDGVECAREIRKLSPDRHIPIIALTAQVIREELNRYKVAGIDDFLIKPCDPDELYEKINKYVKSKGAAHIKKVEKDTSHELIRLDYVKRLANGEEKFVKEMLKTIAEDIPNYLKKLEEAWHDKNADGVQKMAHKLNSPLSSIGLKSLHPIEFFLSADERNMLNGSGYEALSQLKTVTRKAVKEIEEELGKK